MATPYLLDTNILVHYVRQSALWARIRDQYQLLVTDPRPLICVVTVGELRSLSYQRAWAATKCNHMEFMLGYCQKISIDSRDVQESYAQIDAHLERTSQPLGKNDIWIAATTQAMGTRLLTTDRDFDRLYPTFIDRDWIDPNTR